MAQGDFIWCDLSAYEPQRAMAFYRDVFHWDWQTDQPGGMNIALKDAAPVAALYQMPDKFIKIGMPSFWMSYIAVEDAAKTAQKAADLGGKVELGPEAFPGGGTFALIRDPLGAGFTVLQGEAGAPLSSHPGHRLGHGLFVSDVAAIQPFYEALFGWTFQADEGGVSPVTHNGRTLFHCHEIPDPAIRGKEEYWAVLFAQALPTSQIAKAGGQIMAEFNLPEGPAILASDPSGAAFVVITNVKAPSEDLGHPIPWLACIGLALIGISVFTDHWWPWAIFLGLWVIEGLREGHTHLLQPVSRAQHPVLYWIILAVFAALAVLSAAYPFGVY